MRLICPNCGAQYEIDPSVVPDAGRDVQCSNCGHTWFQQSMRTDAGLAQEQGFELTTETPEMPEAAASQLDESHVPDFGPEDDYEAPEPEVHVPEAPVPEAPESPAPQASPQFGDEIEEETAPVAAAAAQPRSVISDSVRDILRAEVEFDNSARPAAEDVPLETQPDLGLQEDPQGSDRRQGLRERMARLRGLDPADAHIAPVNSGKRRDLLPDIEEINSTLSASSERDDDGTVPDDDTRKTRAQRSSFRVTFAALIIIVSLLVLLYVLAPFLSAKVPALQAPLAAYVGAANGVRDWLDDGMMAASSRLDALLGQLNGGAE